MSKHTPGPWTIGGSFYDANCGAHYTIKEQQTYPSLAEWRANACLIAAAPDLLAALRDMLPETPRDPVNGDRPTFAQCEAARAAVAKAEGTES